MEFDFNFNLKLIVLGGFENYLIWRRNLLSLWAEGRRYWSNINENPGQQSPPVNKKVSLRLRIVQRPRSVSQVLDSRWIDASHLLHPERYDRWPHPMSILLVVARPQPIKTPAVLSRGERRFGRNTAWNELSAQTLQAKCFGGRIPWLRTQLGQRNLHAATYGQRCEGCAQVC